MNKSHPRAGGQSQRRVPHCQTDAEIQYLLRAEEEILRAISNRAPVLEILNEICTALDCTIGNIVSLICLPEDDATTAVEIARNAALFGLCTFCYEGIVTGKDELLGTLEMYCAVPRGPSANEVQLIERAACRVAIAIKLDTEARHNINGFAPETQSSRENMHTTPVYLNGSRSAPILPRNQ
jgi:hypothetical protein